MQTAIPIFTQMLKSVVTKSITLSHWLRSSTTLSKSIKARILSDLRTDQAGELGAVRIYHGILAARPNLELKTFSMHHLETENKHLDCMNQLVDVSQRTKITPIWWAAAFMLGYIPAMISTRFVFHTISFVEDFVDRHYQEQLDYLDLLVQDKSLHEEDKKHVMNLRELLDSFRQDEVEHKTDALSRLPEDLNIIMRIWKWIVQGGSEAAVTASRYL